MTDLLTIRRALISVYDKDGLSELAHALGETEVDIISTGSTAKTIADAGVPVTEVSTVTGFPEIMGGRVKTLHPSIHGGILADRSKPEHLGAMETHNIAGIDLVVVNLYPFSKTVANPDVDPAEAIEMIDIGGPTMVRAAAKNHAHVAVVVSPEDYGTVLAALRDHGGIPAGMRRALAVLLSLDGYRVGVVAWRTDLLVSAPGGAYASLRDLQTLNYRWHGVPRASRSTSGAHQFSADRTEEPGRRDRLNRGGCAGLPASPSAPLTENGASFAAAHEQLDD